MAPNVFVRVLGFVNGISYFGAAQVCLARWDSTVDVKVSTDQQTYGPRRKMKVTLDTSIAGTPGPGGTVLGHPGPQPRFDPRIHYRVVPHFSIIE